MVSPLKKALILMGTFSVLIACIYVPKQVINQSNSQIKLPVQYMMLWDQTTTVERSVFVFNYNSKTDIYNNVTYRIGDIEYQRILLEIAALTCVWASLYVIVN